MHDYSLLGALPLAPPSLRQSTWPLAWLVHKWDPMHLNSLTQRRHFKFHANSLRIAINNIGDTKKQKLNSHQNIPQWTHVSTVDFCHEHVHEDHDP